MLHKFKMVGDSFKCTTPLLWFGKMGFKVVENHRMQYNRIEQKIRESQIRMLLLFMSVCLRLVIKLSFSSRKTEQKYWWFTLHSDSQFVFKTTHFKMKCHLHYHLPLTSKSKKKQIICCIQFTSDVGAGNVVTPKWEVRKPRWMHPCVSNTISRF